MLTKLTREYFQECGSRGGKARAAKLTKEQRVEIARKGGRPKKKTVV